jgi:AraC-like DNA-binding protein
MNFREFIVIIMFAFAACFVGFAVVTLLMKRRVPLRDDLALLVGDVGLMSVCNTVYFHSAADNPGLLGSVVIFFCLCVYSPLASAFFLNCSLGLRSRLSGLRRALWAGTALVFLVGVTVGLAAGFWGFQSLAAYVWMISSLLAAGIAGARERRALGIKLSGVRYSLWILWCDVAIAVAMLAALAADQIAPLLGLWILMTASALLAYFLSDRPRKEAAAAGGPRSRYEHSKLENVRVDEAIARLEKAMRGERLFRSPDLRLGDVARRIGVNGSQLSELINLHVGLSFYEYINGFRVEQARHDLLEKPDRTVLEIAFECGFNSKSAFNAAFRKATGTSPSEYRRRAR